MEIFDVVNKNDQVIGRASMEECHSDSSLIHRTVHYTLVDGKQKKVLLSLRSYKVKHDGGMDCFFGEHMVAGESYEEGLKRGVEEELGFVPKKFKEAAHNIFTYDKQREVVRFFIVFWQGEKFKLEKAEIESVKWLSLEEIREGDFNLSDMTRYWIENVDWKSIFV